MNSTPIHAQRGASTLVITATLAFVMLIAVTFASRSLLFEVRTAANQHRAAQAFEAAEAGLAWALVQINSSTAIDDDCVPSASATAIAFRERAVAAMNAQCVESNAGWSCRCPTTRSAASNDDGPPAFSVRVAAGESGQLRITSTGSADSARSQVQVTLSRLPGLDTLPAAALTVRGAATFSEGALTVTHVDSGTSGITVHGAGAVDTSSLRLTSTPGTPASTSVVANDTSLSQLTPQQLFASLFRMDKRAWRDQPVVREIDCERACDNALSDASGSPRRQQLFYLRGGLHLDSATTIGTPQRPVLLVVDGPVVLNAQAVVHGVIYSSSSTWIDHAGAAIHGAVIVENDLQAEGNTQIHYQATALQLLNERAGTYARLPNSWRDF